MTSGEESKPKIVVDDDWKSQARAEKEKLAAAQQEAPPSGAGEGASEARGPLPPATFSAHVTTIASQAFFALGAVPDPQTNKRYVDLDLAKLYIDTLKVLQEKTTGNLTDEEAKLLDNALYDLRNHYVRVAQSTLG
jgi:hypothetical protein